MTYGLDLTEALNNLAERVPHDDLRYLVVTVQIQYMVGGNMAEVLGNLAQVIRDRYQMFAKIRAISSEGRASALIVGILPFFVSGVILLASPQFFTDVSADPLFPVLIGMGFSLMVLGQLTIYRMVNFKF
jgi:tight adherence protein B